MTNIVGSFHTKQNNRFIMILLYVREKEREREREKKIIMSSGTPRGLRGDYCRV